MASWRQHRRRYVATLLAVLLGVGFCAATLMLTAAAREGAADSVALEYSRADVIVDTSGTDGDSLASRVSWLPDVSYVSRVDTAYVDVSWPRGHAGGVAEVSEVPSAPALRWQDLIAGVLPRGAGQVAVEANLAGATDVSVGSRLSVRAGAAPVRVVTVVGLLEPSNGAEGVSPILTGAGVLRSWQLEGTSSELLIRGTGGVSPSALVQQVRRLAPDLTVASADSLRRLALSSLTNGVDVIGSFLQGLAIVSLFVAGLVIANTFRIVMTQRARDLALLRCVGAGRLQVFGMSMGEAALLGAFAAALGTGAGIVPSLAVIAVLGRTSVNVPLSIVAPGLWTLVLPFAGGLVMTMAAALSPAWSASRAAPLAALKPAAPVGVRSRAGAAQVGLGLLLGLVGGLLMAVSALSGRLVPGLGGGILSFAGVLALTPVVVPASIRLVGNARRLVPRRWRGGVPAELSVLDATRNPRRTGAAAAALLVGVTLISMMAVGAASISATESGAVDRVTPVDLTVSGGTVTPRLAERIREVDGLRYVAIARGMTVRTNRGSAVVGALTPEAVANVVRDGSLRAGLTRSSLVTVPVSAQQQVPGGGSRRVALRSGDVSVHLTPAFSNLPDGPLLVTPTVLRQLGGGVEPVALYAQLTNDADPQVVMAGVQDAIEASSSPHPLVVSGGFQSRSTYERTIAVLQLVATALLGVAVLIALVGVGNTLSLSVLERSHEHGLLRALGLTTGQLRLMLANEAALTSGVAALLGTILGVGYGWLGTLTLLHGATTHDPMLVVPYERLGIVLVVTIAAGLLASVLPSRRAARISPTTALATE